MVYMGAKTKILDKLMPIINKIIKEQKIKNYVEPFVGGANVITEVECQNRTGYDNSRTLIALLNKAKENFDDIPDDGSREWFEKARNIYRGKSNESMEDWKIGAIQWLGSYGTRGFPGGYAPNTGNINHYKNNFKNLKEHSKKFSNINFICSDYRDIQIPDGSLVYCDPPYFGTKPYGYANESNFNYEYFWEWIRKLSKKCYVIISEGTIPDDFYIIYETSKRRTLKDKNDAFAVEKIVTWNEGLLKNFEF